MKKNKKITSVYHLYKKNYSLHFYLASRPRKRFRQRKTNIWLLRKDDNHAHGDLLGIVHYRPGWRQFVFTTEPGIDMAEGCELFVAAFLRYQNSKRRKEISKKNKAKYDKMWCA